MRPMYWSLALGPTLLHMAAAAESESSKDGATEQLGHIVVLKPDLKSEHIDEHIDWVNQMHKDTVSGRDNADQGHGIKHTYRSEAIDFHGYAGKFSDEVLRQIKDHQHVDFVEEDRKIYFEPYKREEGQGDKLSDNESKEEPDKVDSPPESVGNQNKNDAVGLLTRGQAYNSFLQKGRIVDAIFWPKNKKRDEADGPVVPAGNETTQAETVFDFTPPNTEVEDFKGVDMKKYFEVPELDEIKDRVAARLKELKEEKKKQKEEKDRMIATNELQTRAKDPKCPGILIKEYKLTEDYNSYLKTLGISGGATISGWGQSASVSGNYLNQAKLTTPGGFEFNKARYKPGRFPQDFGDRWIHGFKTGGKMIARVTFTSKDDTKTTDLKAHAEASLSFWGVKGDLSADVKKSIEEVNKHTNVEASLFYQGELGIFMDKKEASPKDIPSGSAEAVLGQVKSWADKFESFACKHDYAYGPLLDEYETVPGFSDLEDSPEVPDYDIAHVWALEILALMVKVEEQKVVLSSAGSIDDRKKLTIKSTAIKMIKHCKNWVKLAEKDPEKAEEQALALIDRLSTDFVDKYKEDVANAQQPQGAQTGPQTPEQCDKIKLQTYKECVAKNKRSNLNEKLDDCDKESQNALDKCSSSSSS